MAKDIFYPPENGTGGGYPDPTTRNEAAERLKDWLDVPLILKLDEALAAERQHERAATVERIQHAVLFQRNRLGKPSEQIRVTDLLAILDEEVAR